MFALPLISVPYPFHRLKNLCLLGFIICFLCFSSSHFRIYCDDAFWIDIKLIFTNHTGRHAHSRSTLEVPIFWFIYGEPLFVDKHHRAKALSDMVIVVQSEASSWESHLQCNGQAILRDLRSAFSLSIRFLQTHWFQQLILCLLFWIVSVFVELSVQIQTYLLYRARHMRTSFLILILFFVFFWGSPA